MKNFSACSARKDDREKVLNHERLETRILAESDESILDGTIKEHRSILEKTSTTAAGKSRNLLEKQIFIQVSSRFRKDQPFP